jgi:drug/metabolite transporter (DMT)-like permease
MLKVATSGRDEAAGDRLKAIALMVTAIALFSCLDASAKYLVTKRGIPVVEVAWLRFAGQVAYMIAIYLVFRLPALVATRQPWLQALRSLLMLGTTGFNFLALQYLRLDQTITIVFLAPLVVALLAGPLLGEWVGWRRMLAIMGGFLGILVAVRPGFIEVHPAVGYAFAAMAVYAAFMLLTRHMGRVDGAFVTLFCSMLAGAVGLAPFGLAHFVIPASALDWGLLAALGALGGIGHFLFLNAYRLAPASAVTPFLYLQLVTMVGLGYLVFGDTPDAWTLVGSSIVIASGVYLVHREQRRERPSVS